MPDVLTDAAAKQVLRTRWKEITGRDVGFPTGFDGARWVRLLPRPAGPGATSGARLLKAGELVGRHPDGLYAVVGAVGGEIVAAMERRAAAGEFRANIHRGASASRLALSSADQELVLRVTELIGVDVAGVDLISSKRGPLVMEVNASPGLEGIEGATEVDIAGAIIDYAERIA